MRELLAVALVGSGTSAMTTADAPRDAEGSYNCAAETRTETFVVGIDKSAPRWHSTTS